MNPQLQQVLVSSDRLLKATLFKAGDESISLLWLFKLLLVLLIILVVSSLFKHLVRDQLLSRLGMSPGHRETLSTLLSYGIGTVGLVIVLQVNGLNLAPLAVMLGGLGIGVGFGLQEMTKNLISGLTLLVEGKLQVGDYIEFDGLSGYIKEIAIRSTVIRTFDGGDVVVPNSNLTSNRVLNWSYRSLTGKIRLPIGVAYDSDAVLVTETLLNSAYMETRVLHDPPPRVIFKGFGDSALEFELWVWVPQIDEGISVRSALNFIIDYNLRQAGLSIPFPQRDLWLRNPEKLHYPGGNGATQAEPDLDPQPQLATGVRRPVSIRDSLRQLSFFQACSDLHLRELIETGYRKTVAVSEAVFSEGEMGSDFYLVLAGAIESSVSQLDQPIKVYQPGDLFGEAPVMLGLPYRSKARALEAATLFVIHKSSFERLLHLHPQLAELFSQELTKEKEIYLEVRQQLQELGLLDIDEQHHRFTAWVRERLKHLLNSRSTAAFPGQHQQGL